MPTTHIEPYFHTPIRNVDVDWSAPPTDFHPEVYLAVMEHGDMADWEQLDSLMRQNAANTDFIDMLSHQIPYIDHPNIQTYWTLIIKKVTRSPGPRLK